LDTIVDASFAGFLIRFRPKNNLINKNYSKFYFRNILLRAFFVKEMNLVTRASLSQDLLKKLPVTLPTLNEQEEIAIYLERQSSAFSKLIENAENAIDLMQERRTALISAAVTGKIDVRHFVSEDGQGVNHEPH
jgi:type I restriction enzyme, S subunit